MMSDWTGFPPEMYDESRPEGTSSIMAKVRALLTGPREVDPALLSRLDHIERSMARVSSAPTRVPWSFWVTTTAGSTGEIMPPVADGRHFVTLLSVSFDLEAGGSTEIWLGELIEGDATTRRAKAKFHGLYRTPAGVTRSGEQIVSFRPPIPMDVNQRVAIDVVRSAGSGSVSFSLTGYTERRA